MTRTLLALVLTGTVVIPAPLPGNDVTLVQRDLSIPAHSAPGDTKVAFRFASGSRARIISVDPETGWLQIKGRRTDGKPAVGWITRRYTTKPRPREVPPTVAGSPSLDWCPEPRSPDSGQNGRLRIATWNLNNLHAEDGHSTYVGRRLSIRRYSNDYERLRCYVRTFDPDVLAVQEIDGETALRRIIDTEVYRVAVSRRPLPAGMGGRQNTGFAFKKGLRARRRPDFELLDVSDGTLRYGARLDVKFGEQTFRLMSLHLKSGCFDNESRARACRKLRQQVSLLEQWIDDAHRRGDPFILLGDFNRRFSRGRDQIWSELDDGDPQGLKLTSLTMHRSSACRDSEFPEFVDHIVFDSRALGFVDWASFKQINLRDQDRPAWNTISDHCPIVVDLLE